MHIKASRQFLKSAVLSLFTVSVVFAQEVVLNNSQNLQAAQSERPNIVFILTDDMGVGDLGCYGGEVLPTPNIDKMAGEGIRFAQYYSAAPICSPARAGLITGSCPARWNITSYLQSKEGNKNAEQTDFLTTEAPSLPATLKAAGYKTAHFGKWHLGGGRDVKDAPSLLKYGYDEYACTYESPDPDPKLTATDWIWSPQDEVKRWNRTRYFADKTIDFLKRNKGAPCFVNLWPDDVHTPWVGNEAQMKRYPEGAKSERNLKTVLKTYDEEIGRFLERLKEDGLDKNTIVIFTSDNGPAPSFEQLRTQNLRGCKASLFEGGIKMPFIVWSGGNLVSKGLTNIDTVICAEDMFKSLCSIAKAPLPQNFKSEGEDLSAALLGGAPKRSTPIFWEYGRNDSKSFPRPQEDYNRSPNLAIRDGNWKFLINADGTNPMLFHLDEDPLELQNLAAAKPEITAELKAKLLAWRKSMPGLKK